jgi:tRNA pseudouridine55 synthase
MKFMNPNPVEAQGPSGVLLIDKAPDMTSHDVVAIARRALNTKKIGHCGTLDPMATGLLMLVIGRATKIQDLLMSEDKEYAGTLTLGATTSTQDRQGEVLETKPVPAFSESEIRAAFDAFTGEFEQMPPMVSAIKKDGVPLYKLARKGQEVERAARPVRVTGCEVTRIGLPEVDFTVNCSKGFYVRTYAHDIGAKLGCGAHLSALRRTRSGKFTLDRAVTVADLKNAPREDLLKAMVTLAEISLMRGA